MLLRRLDIFWSGEAHPGSAGVPPAIVAAGHRRGLRPLRGGRDARAPRVAASNGDWTFFPLFRTAFRLL